MSAAVDAWIERARAMPIMAGLLGRTVKWKGGSRGFELCGPCPAGCAKDDGFCINTAKNVFICRPSLESARGDVIALAMHVAGVDFLEAVEALTGEPPPRDEANFRSEISYGPSFRSETCNASRRREVVPDCDCDQGLRNAILIERNFSSEITVQADHIAKARALSIWRDAGNPRGSLAERYLASRLCELPYGSALRFHPRCPFGADRLPCMVALFRDIVTDEPVAIHRTALSGDGHKIARKMLGPVGGAAIKIGGDDAVTMGLVVGEGIETCLAARQIGFQPVWALGSVGAISTFPVLPLDGLTILAEVGEPSAKAIQACGRRWTEAGREVIVVSPLAGSDINDSIREAA